MVGYILLGILLFLLLLLCVRIKLTIDYAETATVDVSYLFLKFRLYPGKPKQEAPKQEEEKKEEEKPQQTKKKGPNILQRFYQNQGVGGILALLQNTMHAMGGMFGRFFRQFIIHDLYLDMCVGGKDAAKVAKQYGQASAVVFPAIGYLCTHMKVRRYDIDVSPDFLAKKSQAWLYCKLSVSPIRLIGAGLVLLVQLLFQVLIKLYRGAKPQQPSENDHSHTEETKKSEVAV